MCQTTISASIDDMEEIITSTFSRKKVEKLIEPRKIRKPLMEKKRRARINQSLDELKRIVVDAEKFAGQDLSRVNKLEKADILEMTVRYLKRKVTAPPSPADLYLAGYRQCIEQVQDLLAEQWTDDQRHQSGRRMIEHLEVCVQRLNVPPSAPNRLSFSSSDESNMTTNDVQHRSPGTTRNSCSLSSDDDSVEEDLVTTATATARPSPNHHHTTEFRDTTPKSTWRPW